MTNDSRYYPLTGPSALVSILPRISVIDTFYESSVLAENRRHHASPRKRAGSDRTYSVG